MDLVFGLNTDCRMKCTCEEIEGVIACMHAFIYAWLTGWRLSAVLEK